MLIDTRSVAPNTVVETDVCIVGAGAAGITLARELIGQPFRVSLLESGGFELEAETQSLYAGENVGLPYFPLQTTRLRFFGGSTNHWGGWCQPLDEIDFEVRDWIPRSGWPFTRAEIDPFYRRAQPICNLAPLPFTVDAWATKERPALPFTGDRVLTKMIQFSTPALRFGKTYRDEVIKADSIQTLTYANVVNIETTATGDAVSRVQVACLAGNRFWVSAKLFILAVGGIENPRLLLLSNDVHQNGLGNQHDLVGRFFMEHLHIDTGSFLPTNPYTPPTLYDLQKHMSPPAKEAMGILVLSADTLRSERLLNYSCALRVNVARSVASLKELTWAARRMDGADFMTHLRNVVADLDGAAGAAYGRMVNGRFPVSAYTLHSMAEQVPNPESRVTLGPERDALGKPRLHLDWRLTAEEKRSILRAHEIIGAELGRAGLGRLQVTLDSDPTSWPPDLVGGHHHMGTTRMHADPKQGVVDPNCRVHGLANLYVAGSSVFPTAGCANPTLTIVALAVRLADHVKREMA